MSNIIEKSYRVDADLKEITRETNEGCTAIVHKIEYSGIVFITTDTSGVRDVRKLMEASYKEGLEVGKKQAQVALRKALGYTESVDE